MYIPSFYAENDLDTLHRFIRYNAFGQLVSQVEGRLFVTHMPFLLNEQGTHLIGHCAWQNPQWESLEEQEVLVTFQGEHAYVSPSLYTTPGVPTWNYQAVHVYGTVTVFNDDDEKKAFLETLTHEYERHRATPWIPEYPAARLKAVTGIEIAITEIQGKFKLSGNRPETDQQNIAEEMEVAGQHFLAKAMRAKLNEN